MAKKSLAADLEACWSGKLAVLKEWLTAAYMQEVRDEPDHEIPTSKAALRAIWLAQTLFPMGVFVDRMSQDRVGGIKFEKWSGKTEWRVMPDGACDMLKPEGPEIRRVRVGGPLP